MSSETRPKYKAEPPPKEAFWRTCAALRKEVGAPGYWEALEDNCKQWAEEVSVSKFWKAVRAQWPDWSLDYRKLTGGGLLASPDLRAFSGKGHVRIREKLLQQADSEKDLSKRENPFPRVGAAVPMLNDLVRTRVECQFLDGVDFFASRLEELAMKEGVPFSRNRKGGPEGYFAQHFYFDYELLFRFGGGVRAATVKCEIQIATLLATRIWTESHALYKFWRTREDAPEKWQWTPHDPRFVARQLGHMIHLADGLLVQLRNSSREYKG